MPRKGQITGKRSWNFDDISGKHFGRLTAIECLGYTVNGSGNKNSMWKCVCDCGNYVNISRCAIRRFLRSNKLPTPKWKCVPSCGCSYLEGVKKSRPHYAFKQARKPGQTGRNCLLKSYRISARGRGMEWALSDDEFDKITQSPCHYCGAEPFKVKQSTGRDRGQDYKYNGIDRKENHIGYTTENSLPCCSICNWAKHTMSYGDFMNWICRIVKYHKDPHG